MPSTATFGRLGSASLLWGCLVLLTGCATQAKFQDVMNGYIGAPVESAIVKWGPPSGERQNADGTKLVMWSKTATAQIGGQPMVQPQFSTTTGTGYGGGLPPTNFTANTLSFQNARQPVYDVPLSCTVILRVNRNDTIIGWSANGNHCVAR